MNRKVEKAKNSPHPADFKAARRYAFRLKIRSLTALIILAFFFGTLLLSRHRPIDGDEGYYATAARLVSEGRTPYLDFFYPQMPLLPYLYAPVYKVVGSSLVNIRLMSIALGVLSLFLWWRILSRRLRDQPVVILAGLALVAMNPYFLSWNVTVKTYALTNLVVFATLWALDRGLQSRRWSWFLLAGAAAGLGVGVRLLYLPWAGMLALALGWLQLRGRQKGLRLGNMVSYLGGMLAGLAPSVALFALDPDRFLFNNLRYHKLRPGWLEVIGDAGRAKAEVARETANSALETNPFMLFQMVLVVFGIYWIRWNPKSPLRPLMVLSGVGAVAYSVSCLFPDPFHEQYFTGPLTPLLAPLTVAGLLQLTKLTKRPGTILAVVLCLATVLSAVDLQIRKTGMNLQDVWSFEHLAKVSSVIEDHTEPQDMVLAFWPGYVFEAGRRYMPGMENHFAQAVSGKLTFEEKAQYHVAGKEQIFEAFESRLPKAVILGTWMMNLDVTIGQDQQLTIREELEAKYQFEERCGETRILSRKSLRGGDSRSR